jgi:SAM-dependent methyltransferase
MNLSTIKFPQLSTHSSAPIWVGNGFRVGSDLYQVLSYSQNEAGWNENLALFQEETAGEHFIDNASRTHAIEQIKKYCVTPNPIILEVGCSSGLFLKELRHSFPNASLIGSDVAYQSLIQLSKQQSDIPLLQFDLVECPLPDSCVDVVVLLNVLEHVEKHAEAMQQIKRILKPGGIAILEVPANPNLYDSYDKMYKHFRRYTAKGLKQLVTECDMNILMQSHLGFFLYPGFWFVKKRNQRLLNENDLLQRNTVAKNISRTRSNTILKTLMNFELKLGQYVSYPMGIRCLLTCTKSK